MNIEKDRRVAAENLLKYGASFVRDEPDLAPRLEVTVFQLGSSRQEMLKELAKTDLGSHPTLDESDPNHLEVGLKQPLSGATNSSNVSSIHHHAEFELGAHPGSKILMGVSATIIADRFRSNFEKKLPQLPGELCLVGGGVSACGAFVFVASAVSTFFAGDFAQGSKQVAAGVTLGIIGWNLLRFGWESRNRVQDRAPIESHR